VESASFLRYLSNEMTFVPLGAILQSVMPPEMQGRVLTARNSLFTATAPLGPACGTWRMGRPRRLRREGVARLSPPMCADVESNDDHSSPGRRIILVGRALPVLDGTEPTAQRANCSPRVTSTLHHHVVASNTTELAIETPLDLCYTRVVHSN
jgi:hypothetical protein